MPSSAAHYGLLRYDALGTGQATLIAMNLAAVGDTVQLHCDCGAIESIAFGVDLVAGEEV